MKRRMVFYATFFFFAANFTKDKASILYPKLDSTLEKINEQIGILMQKVGTHPQQASP